MFSLLIHKIDSFKQVQFDASLPFSVRFFLFFNKHIIILRLKIIDRYCTTATIVQNCSSLSILTIGNFARHKAPATTKRLIATLDNSSFRKF